MHTNPSSTDFNCQLTRISNSLRSLTRSSTIRFVAFCSSSRAQLKLKLKLFQLVRRLRCLLCSFATFGVSSMFDRVSAVFLLFVVELAVALFACSARTNLLEVSAKLKQNMRFVCSTVDSGHCAGRVRDSVRERVY